MMAWLKIGLILLGLLAWGVAVIVAGPLVGFGQGGAIQPFAALWVQAVMIGVPATVVLIWGILAWWRRKRGQAALESALVADAPPGDGEVLAERMQQALATLKRAKKSGSYLYDLPWYIIIGPPGSGKTTALLNADIKFPLADRAGQVAGAGSGGGQIGSAMQGFGGTRYCDWWFSEEAVLIDTAGRYTTQDSDGTVDAASWKSFLSLLKKNRPRQPINGVILAFSVADLMNTSPETIAGHAATVRARLAEIHETLKIDFPVYVMFTKADLIAGFREYFASFSLGRRKKVWGVTFQTDDRRQPTHELADTEFDALLGRLSDELMDRLTEEVDGASRIGIFGLPGQLALLKSPITSFLRLVFEPTRYKSNAILRGFYFTSGTQEGTPIDQVLGDLGRSYGSDQFSLMSGRGRSYFLNELLTRVIFAEQGWVSYDRGAIRRASVLRWMVVSLMLLGAAGLGSAWVLSYFANRDLIDEVNASTASFQQAAGPDLAATEISDTDLQHVSALLNQLRRMPTGIDAPAASQAGWSESFGLGERTELQHASLKAYRDALERLLRPRLILRVEQRLGDLLAQGKGNEVAVYEALKVYKLIGRYNNPPPGDDLITSWFANDWNQFTYTGDPQTQTDLAAHLASMLAYDDEVDLQLSLSKTLIDKAEDTLAHESVADRAWSLILAGAKVTPDVPEFKLTNHLGSEGAKVFETRDGSDLATVGVPQLFTRAGFRYYFLPSLSGLGDALAKDKWVLGDKAAEANTDQQLATLGPDLMARYRQEFRTAWQTMLANLRLAPLSADRPTYGVLSAAASSSTSPILKLVEAVAYETSLAAPPPEDQASPTADGGTDTSGKVLKVIPEGPQHHMPISLQGFAKIGLGGVLGDGTKSPNTANGGGPVIIGADIASDFEAYQTLVQGDRGQRLIDQLIGQLNDMQGVLVATTLPNAAGAGTLDQKIGALASTASKLPTALQAMINDVVQEFQGDAMSGLKAKLNTALTTQVVPRCTAVVEGRYPFANDPQRPTPLADFAEVFRPNGLLDTFFSANLQQYADVTTKPWRWDPKSPMADKLSLATLAQFERAAAIRDAFFPGRSPTLGFQVTFTVTLPQKTKAVIIVADGTPITFIPNAPAQTISWPGTGAGYQLQLQTPDNKVTEMTFPGSWALLDLLRKGQSSRSGGKVQVDYPFGNRVVHLEVSVDALENPFLMNELASFACPKGL